MLGGDSKPGGTGSLLPVVLESEPKSGGFAGLLQSSGPALPAALSGQNFGDTADTLLAAVPALRRDGLDLVLEVDDVEVVCDLRDDRLVRVVALLPMDAVPRLTAAWGEPVVTVGPRRTWHFWHDPDAGLRAAALKDMESERMRLEIQTYRPLAAQLGARGEPFTLGGDVPLIGASRVALTAAHGHRLDWPERPNHRAVLVLPAVEYSSGALAARLATDGDRVVGFELLLGYLYHRPWRAEILAILGERLGPCAAGERDPFDGTVPFTCPQAPDVTLIEYPRSKAFGLTVGARP